MKNGHRWWCQRALCIHGFFHPFVIRNLGEMVSIMTKLTTNSIKEVSSEVFIVVPPLEFVFISPMGVLVTLVLVAPRRLILLGVISP